MCMIDIAISRKAYFKVTRVVLQFGQRLNIGASPARIAITVVDNQQYQKLLYARIPQSDILVPLCVFEPTSRTNYITTNTVDRYPGLIHGEITSDAAVGDEIYDIVETLLDESFDKAIQQVMQSPQG